MFDRDQFIADCRQAAAADPSHKAVREVVARAVAEPEALMRALGKPKRAGVEPLYRGPDLTIINLVWGPYMTVRPHDHRMWAVIGMYGGREDNIYWRRLPADAKRGIEAAGAQSLCTGDVAPLGRDIIHTVTNPIPRLSGAIHVYGGDFFAVARSEWDPETLVEGAFDVQKTLKLFEDANARLPPPAVGEAVPH